MNETNEMEDLLTEKEFQSTNDLLRKNTRFYFSSHLILLPKTGPKSFYINLKIGKNHPSKLIENILDIIQVPFRIFVDVFALTESSTRPDPSFLHPSVSTAFNETNLIKSFDDEEKLLKELKNEDLVSRILEKHHITRRLEYCLYMVILNIKKNLAGKTHL